MADRDNLVVESVGLTKIFKDFWNRDKARAVNGIDFAVKQGQVFGLLGPNGSGKSTTVKMILGLLYPTRGTLKVFGEEPQNVDMKSRIGYLPEETYLYKYLTALETLDFFGALFGLTAEKRRERSFQLLDMVGMTHSIDRPVGEFSKGMARRIGLAQALVNDPDLVILDEPTSGLDPIGCREVKDVIRMLASRGKTIILCSHLLADVQDVCDEMIILYGGKVRASGTLKEVLSEQDKSRMVMPRLSAQTTAELKQWLGAHGVPAEKVQIDHPDRDLEDFFLDVIKQAREQAADTAGAHSGGEIAQFLQGKEGEQRGSAVLESLRSGDSKPALAETAPAAPVINADILKELGSQPVAAPMPSAENAADAARREEEKKREANAKISELLKK